MTVFRAQIAFLFSAFLSFANLSHAQSMRTLGPYLMDPQAHSMAVMFQTEVSAKAHVVAKSAGQPDREANDDGGVFHELVLAELAPATRYTYEATANGTVVGAGTFTTAPVVAGTPIRMLIYGDTRDDPQTHSMLARAMRREGAAFVIHTGDLCRDGAMPTCFPEFLRAAAPLISDTPLFPVLGNHDWADGEGLKNYARFLRTPQTPSPTESFYSVIYGPVKLVALDTNTGLQNGAAERVWLEAELSKPLPEGVRYLFVALHHGPYSSGEHGSNPEIQNGAIEKLFRDSHVALVISGHDHMYERGDAAGLKYVVSGGGGAPLYIRNRELPSELAFVPTYHYVRLDIDDTKIALRAIRPDGRVMDACSFSPGGEWACMPMQTNPSSSQGTVVTTSDSVATHARSNAIWYGGGALSCIVAGGAWTLLRRKKGTKNV